MHLGDVESRVQFQTSLEIERCLFVLFLRFIDLPEGEELQPGVVIGRFHVEGAFRQEHGVLVEFEIKKHSGEVEEKIRVVWGDGEGFAKTLDGILSVPLDTPKVAYLVEHCE